MLNVLKVLLCTGFMGAFATIATANTVERIFPQAEIVSTRSESGVSYLLPLGRVKEDRKAGRVQPSRFDRLQGNLDAITWKLSEALSLQDAIRQVDAFLGEQNPEALFNCESRDCGESFAWANSIFNEPILFGSDRNQQLWVIRDRNAARYHVLYLIERPNRRIYLHEDTLVIPADMQSAEQAMQSLSARGRVIVGGISVSQGQASFESLLLRLSSWQAEIKLPLVLVLHRHDTSIGQQALSDQLKAALKIKGLHAQIEDVGAFAPDADAPSNLWLEWVDPRWTPAGK